MDVLSQQLAYLPDYLGGHMLLTVVALGASVIICLPLGVVATRVNWLQWPILTTASLLQTIPGIALLALMVPLLGKIGFLPAIIALFVYSVLPILHNTVSGILNVDQSLIEAADGIGMTDFQKLIHVELPLSASVIIAGIRTSAVWVVGTATLSTPVGAKSLGNYIFSGLQTQNYTAVLVGCVAAATLAILLDRIIHLFEIAASKRSRAYALIAVALLVSLIVGGLAPQQIRAFEQKGKQKIVIGAKTFTEQYILAELIGKKLSNNGYQVEIKGGMGSVILFEALASNEVDCYIDYSGTIWANAMKREEILSRSETLDSMAVWLKESRHIVSLGSLGFENAYALAVSRETASKFKLTTISDLGNVADGMTMGSDYEFLDRPEWQSLKDNYYLPFADYRKLDHSLMYSAINEGEVDVMPAYTTDGRIINYDLVLLKDPKQALPPYDAVLLLSPLASGNKKLISMLQTFIGSISSNDMCRSNKLVDSDGLSVSEAADSLSRWIGIPRKALP